MFSKGTEATSTSCFYPFPRGHSTFLIARGSLSTLPVGNQAQLQLPPDSVPVPSAPVRAASNKSCEREPDCQVLFRTSCCDNQTEHVKHQVETCQSVCETFCASGLQGWRAVSGVQLQRTFQWAGQLNHFCVGCQGSFRHRRRVLILSTYFNILNDSAVNLILFHCPPW